MSTRIQMVDWARDATMYEVNIRQYTLEGTFNAFEKHIPRLADMGIKILWLMPITPISKVARKGQLGSYYACSSYTKINPEFGTEKDFFNLIQCAHEHGMKIIIDWVANHTGREHEWMMHHPEWFTQDATGNFTERNGWDDVVDLDYTNQAMRLALIGAMQYWVTQFNIDGFRCDMAHLVPLDFWEQARTACESIRPLFWLAECEELNYHQVFDVSYAWDWMHMSEKMAHHQATIHDLYNVLHQYAQYPAGALKLFFTSNHDENSWNGTEFEKYGVAYKSWAIFTFTWKGMPLIYGGQEIPNKKRLLFFDKDPIEWNGQPTLHEFYKTLIGLRKQYPAIVSGETFNLRIHAGGAMAYLRYDQRDTILVGLNLTDQIQKINLSHEKLNGMFKNIFSGMIFTFQNDISFELMPGDFFVYVKIE